MRNILNLNQMLDATYDIYRKHMKSFIGYTALTMIVATSMMYGVMLVLGLVFVVIVVAVLALFSNTGDSTAIIVILSIGFCIMILPAFSIMQLVAAGPIHAVEESIKGNSVTFGKMFNYSFKKIWYVITSTLAYFIVYFGIIGIGLLVYALLYFVVINQLNASVQIGVGIMIALIVFLGAFWFSIISALYLPVALCEKRHFFGAIVGSFKLIEGQFFKVLGTLFSYWLSFFIIYLSLAGLASIGSNLLPLLLAGDGGIGLIIGIYVLQMFLILLQFCVSVLLTPVQYITIPIIYFNERNRKYGDDLHKRVHVLMQKQEVIAQ